MERGLGKMNPLLTLWILVLSVSILLGGVFYLADHYAHIIGNFWVLLSVCLTAYCLYYLIRWIRQKKKRGLDQ